MLQTYNIRRSLRVFPLLMFALILLGAAAPAQQLKLIMGGADFTQYPKIQLPFEVLDNSATLDTLRAEDFQVFENGVRMMPVEIECGDLQGAQKITFFFLMDVSFSMAFIEGTRDFDIDDSVKWRRSKDVFIEAFNMLRPQDEAALASFAAEFILEQEFTSDKKLLIDATAGMALRASTAIYTSIATAVSYFGTRTGKRVIILLTDGVDNRSWHSREKAIDIAWQAGIPVFPIGLGFYPDQNDPSRVDQDTLRSIANGTGGKAYFAPSSEDLSRIFSDIIQSIYSVNCVLRYATTDTCEDGSSRNVRVQADILGTVVESEFSYTLPDLRSRVQFRVDIPPVISSRDEYTLPIMADGEVRAGEPMSFRLRLDYDPETLEFVQLEDAPGVIDPADIRVTEAQPGTLLFEASRAMPRTGIGYGTPAALFTPRFLVLDRDSVAPAGVGLEVDYAEQVCAMVPSSGPTEFLVHGCPGVLEMGFDTTLAVISGGVLRLPLTLTPSVDLRQTLEYSFTLNYDPALFSFLRFETEGTISSELKLVISEQPGRIVVSASPGMPVVADGVLLYLYFQAIQARDAMPVPVWLEEVSVAQSTGGSSVFRCLPQVSLSGGHVFLDGICRPLLRLRPRPVLGQNAPNPFTATTGQTRIEYSVTGLAPMRLEVLDQFGRVVALLEEGWKDEGTYSATWTPPVEAPSGVYHCVLREGDTVKTRNIVYTR